MNVLTSRYPKLAVGIPHLASLTLLQGCIANSPCTAVRWVPSSSNLFLVSHADGTIVVYDKARDDGTAFSPRDPVTKSSNASSSSEDVADKEWDPTDSIFVTLPPWHPVTSLAANGKSDKDKSAKNPLSHWRVSRRSIVGEHASCSQVLPVFDFEGGRFRLFVRR